MIVFLMKRQKPTAVGTYVYFGRKFDTERAREANSCIKAASGSTKISRPKLAIVALFERGFTKPVIGSIYATDLISVRQPGVKSASELSSRMSAAWSRAYRKAMFIDRI